MKREWGFLLFLILLACLISPVFADTNVTTVENTTVLLASQQFVDEGLFYFVAAISVIILVIAVFIPRFQDLTSGLATIFLFASAWLSSRVARFSVDAVLDPRIMNTTNGTVLQESRSIVTTVVYAHPDPLVMAGMWVLFGIGFVNFLRVLILEYVLMKEEKEEVEGI